MKNTVEGIKCRLDEAEDRISELEGKVENNTQKEQEKEKRLRKNEEGLREMQDNCIYPYNRDTRRRRRRARDRKTEKVMMEIFPNLMREKVTQIQESQRVPSRRNLKRHTVRHITIKIAKFQDKERI